MSLNRFSNIEELKNEPGLNRGLEWRLDTIPELQLTEITTRPDKTIIVEVHVYTPTNNNYLGGGPTPHFKVSGNNLYIDYVNVFADLNIKRGFFKVVVNAYYEIIGTYDYPDITIQEISPGRREFLVKEYIARASEQTESKLERFLSEYDDPFDHDIALNLGNNQLIKLINFKPYLLDKNLMAVRSLNSLDADIATLTRGSLVEIVTDSWVDNISLDQLEGQKPPSNLRGPNFEIDSGYTTVTETDFKNWTDLLGSNTSTSQKIVDLFFSGSAFGVDLGIDYTAFPNWAYYSSAAERVANFKYKVENIEYYNARLAELNSTSGSASGSLSVNIANTQKKLDNEIGSFDQLERYLYNEPTASLYTFADSGSAIAGEGEFFAVTPYPKRLVNGIQTVYHTTASVSETWYNELYDAAVLYDENNPHALVKSIPEYIRLDSNNSEYEKFVNMIAQHFDLLYTYANALTRVYIKEENPKRGIDKDVLVDLAKSQGWQLVNGNQASQLWNYKLGTDQSGSVASSGSLYSISDEQITGEVWRRIVNNLPYILKTRGTETAVKTLLNIYGIPQTLLSIREYGGPKVGNEWPVLTEDRYSYAIDFNSGSYLEYGSVHVSASFNDWGRVLTQPNVIPPITREFRFKPATTSSMIMHSHVSDTGDTLSHIAVEYTGSYSGSSKYGRINVSFGSGSGTSPITASTDWLPLYNGEYWNLRYFWSTTSEHFNTGSNSDTTYYLTVAHASDFIKGKVSHSGSLEFTPSNTDHYLIWSDPSSITSNLVRIGGSTGSSDNLNVNSYLSTLMGSLPGTFNGYMQEYREWLEAISDDAFDDHILNPTSYVSGLTATSSYDTLVRHYTLGSETIGFRLDSDGTIISSSHPNQSITDFTLANSYSTNATSNGFDIPSDLERGNFQPVEETYYIRGASLGANNPRSQKIRLEDNEITRQLSPTNTSEVSSFDTAPLDSNKLGLFYSFADQVNKDIFNHTGRVDLDDYIGDPDDEYELTYNDLRFFSAEYWKKFTNASDVNSYNRIFSQYDFSIFNQIKQTLPERVDEATGLLVEPNTLERAKVQITKPIGVENPQYNMLIANQQPTWSGDYANYEGVIDQGESAVLTPSATKFDDITDTINTIYTGSMNYCTIETSPVDELVSFTASINDLNYTQANGVNVDYGNQKILFEPSSDASPANWTSNSSSGKFDLLQNIDNGDSAVDGRYWLTTTLSDITSSSYMSKQLRFAYDTMTQYDVKMRIKSEVIFAPSSSITQATGETGNITAALVKLEDGADPNSRIMQVYDYQTTTYDNAQDGVNKSFIEFKSVLVPANTQLYGVYQFYTDIEGPTETQEYHLKRHAATVTTEEVCHSVKQHYIEDCRLSSIYDRKIYHYSGSSTISDKRLRDADGLVSRSLGLFYSESLETACYRDDFFETTERLFYAGTRLVAAGINLPTKDNALNGTPVIEVYEVNPNQLFYNRTPQQPGPGNTLDPGNITVR